MDLKKCETEFYDKLAEFKALSFDLIERGQPYAAVLLNHELYRFLYPIEPYASVEHTDPVPFALNHLTALLGLGRNMLTNIHGYNIDLASHQTAPAKDVETETSDLYSGLWQKFDEETLLVEARKLVEGRLPNSLIRDHVVGKRVLDMGCGSGRYSLALAALGAAEVVAVDYQGKAYRRAAEVAQQANLPVTFMEANVLELPFADRSFDFVFSNGVLHHTRDWQRGVREFARLMATSGYLYLYACGGFFWNCRAMMREVFARIPADYTEQVIRLIGLPRNRFIFMDTWYVPIEGHLKKAELESLMTEAGVKFTSVPSKVRFDPAYGLTLDVPGAEIMWGEGEHRYLLVR